MNRQRRFSARDQEDPAAFSTGCSRHRRPTVESAQTCPDGWPAGSLATARLKALTAGRLVICDDRGRDRDGRTIARCTANGEDLGAILVREGMAWAFVRYSSDYVQQEAKAKADRLGVHAHRCVPAWEWRAQRRQEGQ